MILNVLKKEGETPLQRLERYREVNPALKNEKMTYAGRLDPMAEGVLLVLTGEDVHKKDELLHLDKIYEFEVLWGVSSDTYDILGEILISGSTPQDEQIKEDTPTFKGAVEIPYPAYSSKTFKGRPLWSYAREGKLDEIEFPKRSINIKTLDYLYSKTIQKNMLLSKVIERVSKIKGDFRQEEIIASWKEGLGNSKNNDYRVSGFRAIVSSGTYIRSLAVRIGEKYNAGALAWSIKRTSVGHYKISESID